MMDTMRKLFVVLGFLLVVGFFGVEMAREIKITEREEKQEATTNETNENKKGGAPSSPAKEAEAKRSKPNAGEFREVEKKFVDLTGCEEVEEFPFRPEFGKPVEKIFDPGDYAITTEGSTNQWSSDGKIRGFWSDGVIMDLEGNNVWILEAGPNLPVQDAPYGTVTMKIGRKGATRAIGLGTKLHLKKTTSIYMGSNIFPGMEFYKNSSWRIQVHTWKCPRMADN